VGVHQRCWHPPCRGPRALLVLEQHGLCLSLAGRLSPPTTAGRKNHTLAAGRQPWRTGCCQSRGSGRWARKGDLARVLDHMACAGSMDQLNERCTLAAFSLSPQRSSQWLLLVHFVATIWMPKQASFSTCSLPACQNRVAGKQTILEMPIFHLLEDARARVVGATLNTAGHRIHDGLSRGTGQEMSCLLGDGLISGFRRW